MLFVGDDWAEDHHDVELQDEEGRRLGRARLPEGVAGVARLHELIGAHLGEDAGPEQVAVGIETDRGPRVAGHASAASWRAWKRRRSDRGRTRVNVSKAVQSPAATLRSPLPGMTGSAPAAR